MTHEVSGYYETLFAEHVRADNLLGPRLVLDVVSHQAETLRSSVRQARGAEREQAVRLASRYEEFLGWLNQDAGRLDQAMIHTDRARDLAAELRDPLLAAYLLMRKSNIATDFGDPVPALAMADAALSQTEHLPPTVRAVVLRQKALALAGLGQGQACNDVATEALETVEAGRVWPEESSLAPYCTTSYVAMEAAACWACSHEHASWPGTVSISAATLHAIIGDVITSLKASGVHRLVIVNGHGGNYVLSNIVQEASASGPMLALFPARDDWRAAREAAGCQTDNSADMHAGELETSILLHALPDLVRPSYTTADHEAPSRPHLLTLGMHGYTTSGVIGKPSIATPEKGKALLDAFVGLAASHLDLLRTAPDDSSENWPRTE